MYHERNRGNMSLISTNKHGRIYIDLFQIRKLMYNYIQNNYQYLQCYKVDYKEGQVDIYLNGQQDISVKEIKNLQKEGIMLIRDNLGLYVENINIILG